MGLSGFKGLGSMHSRANAAIVARGLCPKSLGQGGPNPASWCPVHPACEAEYVPPVSSSNDRRIVAYREEGAAHVMCVTQKTCLASGGAINRSQLEGYLLVEQAGTLYYAASHLVNVLGVIKTGEDDLAVPFVKQSFEWGIHGGASLATFCRALRVNS